MRLPEPGDLFDERYRIDGVLGEGGFATVFAAVEPAAKRTVAVKVLKPAADGYDSSVARRFERELLAIGRLRSEHTVRLLAHGKSADGLLYAVFEHLRGVELAEVLSTRGRLEPAEVEHVLRQLLGSLDEAHRCGVLHRDLKPENVLIVEQRGDPLFVKLIDFGIARLADEGSPAITKTGELIGTP